MSRENTIIKPRLLNLDPARERLFRINAGMGWVGKILRRKKDHIVLGNPRPLHAGPTGWPDLCGWETVTITPDMVGKKIAVFVGEEVKYHGKVSDLTKEQEIFGRVLTSMGGIFRVLTR